MRRAMVAANYSMRGSKGQNSVVTGLRVLTASIVLAICVALPSAPLKSHPHVWVTVQTQVMNGPNGAITGLRHTWTFDEFYSAFATQGMDKDGDGKFSAEELAPLAEENVKSLHEFDYFTFVKVDGEQVERLEPKDYSLELTDGILTLHFTLPLKAPADARKSRVAFDIYDPTYFVAFSFDKANPVMMAASGPAGCAPRFVEQKTASVDTSTLKESFYSELGPGSDFGVQFAKTVEIACNAR